MQEFQYRKEDTGQWVKALDKRTPDGVLISLRIDVTDLKSAKERLATIIEGAGVGTWTWRSATRASEIDAPWAKMLGYTPKELGEITDEKLADMMHPDDRAATLPVWDSLNHGEDNSCETIFRLRHKDGHWVSILSRGRVIRRDVLTPLDPFAADEFQHLHLVELGDRLEVEAVEAFDGRKLRGLDAAFHHAPRAVDQLQLDQARAELDMIQPLGGAPRADARRLQFWRQTPPGAGQLLIFPQEGRQLQRLEMMGKQDLRGLGHSAASVIRAM